MWDLLTIIVALMAMSLIIRDTPLYHIVEYFAIGGAVANLLVLSMKSIYTSGVVPLLSGNILIIVPLILGLLMLARWSPSPWLTRYPIAISVATGTGIMLISSIQAQIVNQIVQVGTSITGSTGAFGLFTALLGGIGTITAITYFIFTREHKGILKIPTRIGRLFIIGGFGVGFGTEIGWYFSCFAAKVSLIFDYVIKLVT